MLDGDSEHPTTSQPHELNPSYAPCLCDWMMGGIKSSSTCLTSLEELTALTILKLSGFRYEGQFGGWRIRDDPVE